ncbi:MAG: EcsC family protein [Myxococcota bacterium]|nr:EcsC family protein [Myxococcota bacterium]
MASTPLSQIKDLVQDRLDQDLLPSLYAACSLRTREITADLQARGVVWSDWRKPLRPALGELDESAQLLIDQAKVRAGVIGAAGGVGGAVGVAPEVLASLVHTLRLAQRLAVVYGFDPETDKGRVMLWRALAAAYDVDLPDQAQLNLRVRDLPGAAAKQVPKGGAAAAMVVRRVVQTATSRVIGRGIRLVPGLTIGLAASRALDSTRAKGERMKAVYRAAFEEPPADLVDVIDVVEVH